MPYIAVAHTARYGLALIAEVQGQTNTFKKDKRITIRLYDHDFLGIQKKATEMGIPYQTLISGIIHRYVEGDLKSDTG